MSDVYLGNPLLKKANTAIEFTEDQIIEFLKCKQDPIYFANNYWGIWIYDSSNNYNKWRRWIRSSCVTNFATDSRVNSILDTALVYDKKFNDEVIPIMAQFLSGYHNKEYLMCLILS